MSNALLAPPIEGTLAEKHSTFQQIASTASAGVFGGWDTVPKLMAACWAGDALRVHPVTYMNGVYVMNMSGRLIQEPKWEFVNALLSSRLPGFDFEIHQRDAKAADITFKAAGRSPKRVRYSIEDAQRQGFMSKDTYKQHTPEMLWKQAFKRGADMIGADVLAGMPSLTAFDDEFGTQPAIEPAESVRAKSADPNPESGSGAPQADAIDWHQSLRDHLTAMYGKLSAAQKLEKCSFLASEARGEAVVFRKGSEIGPMEAREIVIFLGNRGTGAAAPDGPEHLEEEAPPVEPVRATESPSASEKYQTWQGFKEVADRAARALKGHVVMKETREGNFWFVHEPTVAELGLPGSVHIQKDGDLMCPPDLMVKLGSSLDRQIAATGYGEPGNRGRQ